MANDKDTSLLSGPPPISSYQHSIVSSLYDKNDEITHNNHRQAEEQSSAGKPPLANKDNSNN